MTKESQIIAILPTGDWSFVEETSDVSFYSVSSAHAEDILAGKMIVDTEDLAKMNAKHITGKAYEAA